MKRTSAPRSESATANIPNDMEIEWIAYELLQLARKSPPLEQFTYTIASLLRGYVRSAESNGKPPTIPTS